MWRNCVWGQPCIVTVGWLPIHPSELYSPSFYLSLERVDNSLLVKRGVIARSFRIFSRCFLVSRARLNLLKYKGFPWCVCELTRRISIWKIVLWYLHTEMRTYAYSYIHYTRRACSQGYIVFFLYFYSTFTLRGHRISCLVNTETRSELRRQLRLDTLPNITTELSMTCPHNSPHANWVYIQTTEHGSDTAE